MNWNFEGKLLENEKPVLTDIKLNVIPFTSGTAKTQIVDGCAEVTLHINNVESGGAEIYVDDVLDVHSTNPAQNKVISTKFNELIKEIGDDEKKISLLEEKLEEVFQSVSKGKKKVAAAITDKGVETAADATFDMMADNIEKIESGAKSDIIHFQLPTLNNLQHATYIQIEYKEKGE